MKNKYPLALRVVAMIFAAASLVAIVLLFMTRGLEFYGLAVLFLAIMVVTIMFALAHLIEIQEIKAFPEDNSNSDFIDKAQVDQEGNIHCPNCNTINPPQFTMCRKCNTPLKVK